MTRCRNSNRASIRVPRSCWCRTAPIPRAIATPTELKQKLVRSDVFLYAIGIDSIDARNSTRINPFTLNELTSQGGGYTEIIRSTEELGPATERIAEELNHQYMIGYTPTDRADGSYHTVRVKVSNDSYRVRARRGVVR